jgi:hypothetical protein
MATRGPRPGKCQCMVFAAMTLRSISNILPLNCQYILTQSRVKLYLYIIHLKPSVCIRYFTLYSIFQWTDIFPSRGFTSFISIIETETTDSFHINYTVISLLYPWESCQRSFELGSYMLKHWQPTISLRPGNPYSHPTSHRTSDGWNQGQKWSLQWTKYSQ